jgi:hypothetical protein
MGQTEKNSVRAYVFRFAPELGHVSMQSACLKGATDGSENESRPVLHCAPTCLEEEIASSDSLKFDMPSLQPWGALKHPR